MEEGRPYLLHWWSLAIRPAWNGAVDKSNNTTARAVEEKLIEPRWIHTRMFFLFVGQAFVGTGGS